jgi:hypothetical protein
MTTKSRQESRHTEETRTSRRRRHRSRPTPRWLKTAEGMDAVAQRRVLLVLSVLSGERPVTDAVQESGISRPLYYQLETRALQAMLRALTPGAEDGEGAAAAGASRVAELQGRLKRMEQQKRRAERLLLVTRKLVKPGSLTTGRGRPPKARTALSSMSPGTQSSMDSKPRRTPLATGLSTQASAQTTTGADGR